MVKKERLLRNFEQLIENDLSLPDYCGDIVKILNSIEIEVNDQEIPNDLVNMLLNYEAK